MPHDHSHHDQHHDHAHDRKILWIAFGLMSILALSANLSTAAILYKTRGRDSNMRSIWLCSRNDALSNIAIIIAAGFVYATGTLWPDLIVALIITWLEGSSALQIIRHAREELDA